MAEEPQSYLAMLNDIQISDTQQIGPSFSRPPVFVISSTNFHLTNIYSNTYLIFMRSIQTPHGINSDLNTQQTNNMMVETPPPFR